MFASPYLYVYNKQTTSEAKNQTKYTTLVTFFAAFESLFERKKCRTGDKNSNFKFTEAFNSVFVRYQKSEGERKRMQFSEVIKASRKF